MKPTATLGDLTIAEKASLRAGTDAWHFPGVPRLGIPHLRVADCGHGITVMGEGSTNATSFPTGIGMASTWNIRLLEEAGAAIGREARGLGVSVVLGPKLNLHRVPLNGRSFETFSEDPWLAGLLGAAVARGIQSEGVGACIKAIAANSQQADQEVLSSEVSERALRELYLRQFQLAIELADPIAVMTSYNRINGVYPSEHAELLSGIVKGEWAYEGVIVSDWRAVHSPRALTSGLDIEMPGPGRWLDEASVLAAVDDGRVSASQLDDSAQRMLRLHRLYGASAEVAPETGLVDTERNRALALEVAEESIVLLQNIGGVLPLDRRRLARVLVVGPNAEHARLGGGGSASVTPAYSISPLEGIREALRGFAEVEHLEGSGLTGAMVSPGDALHYRDDEGILHPGVAVRYRDRDGTVVTDWVVEPTTDLAWGWASPAAGVGQSGYRAEVRAVLIPPATGSYRLGLQANHGVAELMIGEHRLGRISEEALATQGFEADYSDHYETDTVELVAGEHYELTVDFRKTGSAAALRFEWEEPGSAGSARLRAAATAADAVVVCVGLSNMLEGGARDRSSMRLPEAQEDLIRTVAGSNENVAVVLNNGGPLDVPWADDVPAILEAWYPGQEGGRAVARVLFGDVNPSGKLPDTMADAHAYPSLDTYPGEADISEFREELMVGYRHVDAAGITPRFPFGFGLSYTEFAVSAPRVTVLRDPREAPEVDVAVELSNIGSVSGAEVVQLYLAHADEEPDRPVRQLRAFTKAYLEPGASASVTFRLGVRELEIWDQDAASWRVRAGGYIVGVGTSSRDLVHVPFDLTAPEA
ncbi:beta-glucosidase [Microbacterium sp. CFH 90308]|uniref:Beta-glucosidase n=1 Tax=Microbacterium salsuginis TaxID=2722803 RepID=A0ABX1KCF2_9MICO|nr:glycoside hydrolase family 3 C-terminal domain-containing protein [Microbacterium sp. CFH 90308]NLP84187.1 beta-glucosidase [Microbacterium sp. CFH 90308]